MLGPRRPRLTLCLAARMPAWLLGLADWAGWALAIARPWCCDVRPERRCQAVPGRPDRTGAGGRRAGPASAPKGLQQVLGRGLVADDANLKRSLCRREALTECCATVLPWLHCWVAPRGRSGGPGPSPGCWQIRLGDLHSLPPQTQPRIVWLDSAENVDTERPCGPGEASPVYLLLGFAIACHCTVTEHCVSRSAETGGPDPLWNLPNCASGRDESCRPGHYSASPGGHRARSHPEPPGSLIGTTAIWPTGLAPRVSLVLPRPKIWRLQMCFCQLDEKPARRRKTFLSHADSIQQNYYKGLQGIKEKH